MRTTGGAIILPSTKWLNSPTSPRTRAPATMIPIPEIYRRYFFLSFVTSENATHYTYNKVIRKKETKKSKCKK